MIRKRSPARPLWRRMPIGLKMWAEDRGRFTALHRGHFRLPAVMRFANDSHQQPSQRPKGSKP